MLARFSDQFDDPANSNTNVAAAASALYTQWTVVCQVMCVRIRLCEFHNSGRAAGSDDAHGRGGLAVKVDCDSHQGAHPPQRALPSCNVPHLGLAEGAALGQLPNRALHVLALTVATHDVREYLAQEFECVMVDLLKLQEERVMTLGAVDAFETGVGDMLGQFLLLSKREEAVAFNAEDEGGLLDHGQGFSDGFSTPTAHVVRVELARHGDVAIAVKTLDKLVRLVAQIGLRREVGRAWGHNLATRKGAIAIPVLRPVELRVTRPDLRILGCLVRPVAPRPPRRAPLPLVTVIMNMKMGLGGRCRSFADRLATRRIGGITAEAGLE
jgi:hypothetical protein